VLDWSYRILGVVVQARFQIALLVAIANTVLLLLELQLAMEAPPPLSHLYLFDSPLLLILAVGLLAQLPPGVVFRSAPPEPRETTLLAEEPDEYEGRWGCRASAWFRTGGDPDWRLLAASTLQVSEWGGIEITAPTFAPPRVRPSLTPLTVRTLDWYRPFGLRPPLWGSDHLAVRWQQSRRRRAAAPPIEITNRLTIPARARQAAVAGWQYAGLRRYPAIRLTYTDDGNRKRYSYLAFGGTLARDAVLARLAESSWQS
jgi:hypothetical protein